MIIDQKKIFRYMDVGFYIVFIPIILLLIPTNKFVEYNPYFFMILLIYMIVIYLINRQVNITACVIKGNYKKAILFALLTLVITYLVPQIDVESLYPNDINTPPFIGLHARTKMTWLLYLITMSFGLMTGLIIELFREIINRQAIEAERNKAEIALYKSQINPHFMFNTLNTLYGLFITKSDMVEDVFIKFTDIIKYMYSNTEREKIPIIEEVNYINQYIDLQSLRLGSHNMVDFNSEIDDNSVLIPPMILITFVENAFKYGISSTKTSLIHISIVLKNGILTFTTTNDIFVYKQAPSGIGIDNCRKRLNLLYPKRYSLDCQEQDNIFYTKLIVEL